MITVGTTWRARSLSTSVSDNPYAAGEACSTSHHAAPLPLLLTGPPDGSEKRCCHSATCEGLGAVRLGGVVNEGLGEGVANGGAGDERELSMDGCTLLGAALFIWSKGFETGGW